MAKSLIKIIKGEEDILNNKTRALTTQLYDFLENLPTQWEGVPHICKLLKELRNERDLLSDILYAIGEDPHLFFWWQLIIRSLSIREFDHLIQTLRKEFVGEDRLINEMDSFFLCHQEKLLKEISDQVDARQKRLYTQHHEGRA